jgi:hypothetical protein
MSREVSWSRSDRVRRAGIGRWKARYRKNTLTWPFEPLISSEEL